jgi:HAD domain in Swiss Army Knife RNA repair proteins
MSESGKPLLFMDIDGVLSLFGFQSDSRPAGEWINVEGIVHLLSATASEHLQRLAVPFDLVWCSGWEEKANEHLLGALVLPTALPFLTFTDEDGAQRHWKLAAIEAHAGDRPLAWIDDAHDDSCRAWASSRAAPTLLVATDPAAGLTAAHVEALERWADGLAISDQR